VRSFVDSVSLPAQDLAYGGARSSVVLDQQDANLIGLVQQHTWTLKKFF
jgi:hypothetical protein